MEGLTGARGGPGRQPRAAHGTAHRRALLAAAGTGAAAVTAFGDPALAAAASSRRPAPLIRGGRFDLGVISGDPTDRGVTLWTRVADLEQRVGTARLEVARDPEFRRVVHRGRVPLTFEHDHCAKARITGLRPDERYRFRFSTRDAQSPVGRTQTAPARDSSAAPGAATGGGR